MAEFSDELTDISRLPELTFGDVEEYARKESGCSSTTKAYKFCAEPGYLHNIKVRYSQEKAKLNSRCYRSMKKSESPHTLEADIDLASKSIKGRCSCVAGVGGFCHHVVGLLFYMAHCKTLGYKAIPDELTCTSIPQRWSVPRERKIANKPVQDLMVKKPRQGADYSKFIKSTLYSPAEAYPIMPNEQLSGLEPQPLMPTIAYDNNTLPSIAMVASKFGKVPKGSVLSYQQKLSNEYVINDNFSPQFPALPLENSQERITNNYLICLPEQKLEGLNSISVTLDQAVEIEHKTLSQSASQLWYSLREKRITASKFELVTKRQSGFDNLVKQLNPTKRVVTPDMQRGIDMEPKAVEIYANVAKEGKVNIYPSGLIINPFCPWLGASPDRKVYDFDAEDAGLLPFGLLEVKVPKEGTRDFSTVFYIEKGLDGQLMLKRNHQYYHQVQCQMALTGLDWCDFFSYINDSVYHCERILFDQDFFEQSKDKVDSFYFNYYLR